MNMATGAMEVAYPFPPGLEPSFSGGTAIAVRLDESFLIYKGTAYSTSDMFVVDSRQRGAI